VVLAGDPVELLLWDPLDWDLTQGQIPQQLGRTLSTLIALDHDPLDVLAGLDGFCDGVPSENDLLGVDGAWGERPSRGGRVGVRGAVRFHQWDVWERRAR